MRPRLPRPASRDAGRSPGPPAGGATRPPIGPRAPGIGPGRQAGTAVLGGGLSPCPVPATCANTKDRADAARRPDPIALLESRLRLGPDLDAADRALAAAQHEEPPAQQVVGGRDVRLV